MENAKDFAKSVNDSMKEKGEHWTESSREILSQGKEKIGQGISEANEQIKDSAKEILSQGKEKIGQGLSKANEQIKDSSKEILPQGKDKIDQRSFEANELGKESKQIEEGSLSGWKYTAKNALGSVTGWAKEIFFPNSNKKSVESDVTPQGNEIGGLPKETVLGSNKANNSVKPRHLKSSL